MRNKDLQTLIPITKKNIYRIALWPLVRRWLVFCAPISLVLIIFWLGGRMDAGATIGSILFISFFAVVYILPQIHGQYMSLALLRSIPNFDVLLEGKQLYWLNGAWGYADQEWFIRVGPNHCAVLRAGEINFGIPVHRESYTWKSSGKFGHYHVTLHHLYFTGNQNQSIVARSEADQNMQNWIRLHGGSFAWDKKSS